MQTTSFRRSRIVALLGTLLAGMLTLSLYWTSSELHAKDKNQKGKARPPVQFPFGTDDSIRKVHSILLWDSFSDFRLEDGTGMFTRFKCPQKHCTMTRNRSVLADSPVVLFHMRETTSPDQLPVRGNTQQRWVFAMKEPPVYSEFDAQSFNGLFDWTMTYRPDSDIPWPYGSFYLFSKLKSTLPDYHKIKTESQKSQTIPDDGTEPRRQKSVTWIVSRCKSGSKREDFVAELQKYIDVDVYGRCGPLRCTRGNGSDSCQARIKDYHFYLAFENSFCPDYVTEKLYKVLAMEDRPPIPVVLGGADYSKLAPPHSVINARDFPDPQTLANYLSELTEDKEKYNEYHEWRRKYRISIWGTPSAICKICSKAHEPSRVVSGVLEPDEIPRVDLTTFWSKESCRG
ncbi:hypothetical protein RvY_11426 [Ramazzottius varieornatus]|uniref:Fucosyltransferase n=1 Tax=Ramazzottius varieornatus TaxID=947166 RepID=A0A1D1VG50_RAMVA|nr:hypothetical protein RvY_11426 [Ramazzottius varieornatus]